MHRVLEFDFARSLCVLWIVGFWHLYKWLSIEYYLSGVALEISARITMIVLGTFTFISGWFLQKYTFSCFHDVLFFCTKTHISFLYSIANFNSIIICSWLDKPESIGADPNRNKYVLWDTCVNAMVF